MQNTNSQKFAVWATIAAVVAFAAAFMPWGEIQATPSISLNIPGGPFAGNFSAQNPFGGMTVTLPVTGWDGSITLGGLKLPNWLTVLLAGAIAALAWLAATNTWLPPRYLPLVLALIGLAQALVTVVILMSSGKSSVGVGALLMAATFAGLVYASVVFSRRGVTAETHEQGGDELNPK